MDDTATAARYRKLQAEIDVTYKSLGPTQGMRNQLAELRKAEMSRGTADARFDFRIHDDEIESKVEAFVEDDIDDNPYLYGYVLAIGSSIDSIRRVKGACGNCCECYFDDETTCVVCGNKVEKPNGVWSVSERIKLAERLAKTKNQDLLYAWR